MLEPLRALTLQRPWAFAFSHLGKPIENRDWRPPARVIGKWLAIHAGKTLDEDSLEALRAEGFGIPDNGGPGGIVCVAHLVGFVEVKVEGGFVSFPRADLADQLRPVVARGERWLFGRYGWCFDEVVTLREPVPCKGAQGLWVVPEREAEVVRARFAEVSRG